MQRLKQERQKSSSVTRQTDGKNLIWFGEIERKLAKLSKTTFTFSYLFYALTNSAWILTCLSHTAYKIHTHTQTQHHTPHTQTNTDVSQLNISHISNTHVSQSLAAAGKDYGIRRRFLAFDIF
jgi:hypothetical protein